MKELIVGDEEKRVFVKHYLSILKQTNMASIEIIYKGRIISYSRYVTL